MPTFSLIYNNDPQNIRTYLASLGITPRLPIEKFSRVGLKRPGVYRMQIVLRDSFRDTPPSEHIDGMRKAGRRGLTLIEGLALIEQHPEVLKKYSLDILHSLYGKECIPTLYAWDSVMYLSAICPDAHEWQCAGPEVVSCDFIRA